MTIWSYIVQIQQLQNETYDSSITIESKSTSYTSTGCTQLFPNDGGLLWNFIVDLVLAAFLVILTICIWKIYLKREEQKALSYPPCVEAEGSGSEVDIEAEETAEHETKLVWYKALCQIWSTSDTTVELRQGVGGVRYMHLSEYILIILLFIMVLCLSIILPINMTGDKESTLFGQMCITNLDSSSNLLWAHYILAPVFFFTILVVVWMYTAELGYIRLDEAERVSIIRNVDTNIGDHVYWEYISEAGLKENVEDIQLGYDVSDLYDKMRHRTEMERMVVRYTDLELDEPDTDNRVTPGTACGCCACSACCPCDKVEGLEYYNRMLFEAEESVQEELELVKSKRTSFLFVVWSTAGHCKMFINLHKLANLCSKSVAMPEAGARHWQVRLAPVFYDINWENMSIAKWLWWTRAAAINFVLFLFVIFFTTPIILVSFFSGVFELQSYMSGFYYAYLTILLLIILTTILPDIVTWTCKLECHRTRSGYYHWILRKTFSYLILSILLLPMLGYFSLSCLIQAWFLGASVDIVLSLTCMFSAYNSAFFTNLIIAAALIGRSIELLQLTSLLCYIWERSKARTKREINYVFKNIKRKFNIGYNYAKFQAYLSIVISLSLVCPIITFFGMFLMVLKYTVDKYLMVHCTAPCGSYSTSLHYTAAYFTVFNGALLQLFMFIYAVVNFGLTDGKTILSGIILLIIIVFLILKLGKYFYKLIFPKQPSERHFYVKPDTEDLKDVYTPPLMLDKGTKLRKRLKRLYHGRNTSLSSVSALLENSMTEAQYRSINDAVDRVRSSLSPMSTPSINKHSRDHSSASFVSPGHSRDQSKSSPVNGSGNKQRFGHSRGQSSSSFTPGHSRNQSKSSPVNSHKQVRRTVGTNNGAVSGHSPNQSLNNIVKTDQVTGAGAGAGAGAGTGTGAGAGAGAGAGTSNGTGTAVQTVLDVENETQTTEN